MLTLNLNYNRLIEAIIRLLAREGAMEICNLCKEQAKKGRHAEPHENLERVETRSYPRRLISAYSEQDFLCRKCGAAFIHSDDRADNGWLLQRERK